VGDDGLVVVCDDLDSGRRLEGIEARVPAALAVPVPLGDGLVTLGATVAAAVGARPGDTPDELLRAAGEALDRAKRDVPRAGGREEPVRVFLCDDVPDLRALLRAFLEEDGACAVVGEAGDGARLARAVASTGAEVVLLDLSMPDVDGLEAVAALRAADPAVGIVVLSGFEQARMEAQALALGADRYLEKRAGMAEVRRAVADVVSARREPL